jgi:two-component system CheB/CheR fusion protein
MDGYAVAQALRNDSRTASALLVAMTSHSLPGDERRALEAGFDAHLAKPVDRDALARRLAYLDDHRSLH